MISPAVRRGSAEGSPRDVRAMWRSRGPEHWTDATPRPGVFTRNTDAAARRRERMNRVAAANRVLSHYRMNLADWQGSAFVLSTATGKIEIVDNLAHLWLAAERLLGRPCDPLDEALIALVEREL